MAANYLPCPCVEYVPDPLLVADPPDPCVTEAQRLGRLTQAITCPGSTPPLTDLLAYWKMEEDGLVVHQDSHTGNYDLDASLGHAAAPGKILNASRASGSPPGDLSSADGVFGLTGAMSLAGWINFENVLAAGAAGSVGMYIVGKQDLALGAPGFSTAGYMLYLKPSLKLAFWQGNGAISAEVEWTSAAIDGSWYHIVAGYTGSNQFIQVNNGTRQSKAGVTPTVGSQDFAFGGAYGQAAAQLTGLQASIDEWGVWLNRALSTADATYLWNGGNGRTYPF